MGVAVKSIEWKGDSLLLLEQRNLPKSIEMVECHTYLDVAKAIKDMVVRGAPAIGAAAAYGIVLAADAAAKSGRNAQLVLSSLKQAAEVLANTRPTAVNLFWAIDRMMEKAAKTVDSSSVTPRLLVEALEKEADAIAAEDVDINMRIGRNGSSLMPKTGGVLTHCNAGALATVGFGTALGVIRAAYEDGCEFRVYADETRPYMQGTRLTTWELMQEGIPVTLIADNMAGYAMKAGLINAVIVGADRVTANGDVANKIGTYSVAVLARHHGIPFYVAAPRSTVDLKLQSGDDIPIEQRDLKEITHWKGDLIAPEGVDAINPAFDVTPSELVSGIVTEVGVVAPPYKTNLVHIMSI